MIGSIIQTAGVTFYISSKMFTAHTPLTVAMSVIKDLDLKNSLRQQNQNLDKCIQSFIPNILCHATDQFQTLTAITAFLSAAATTHYVLNRLKGTYPYVKQLTQFLTNMIRTSLSGKKTLPEKEILSLLVKLALEGRIKGLVNGTLNVQTTQNIPHIADCIKKANGGALPAGIAIVNNTSMSIDIPDSISTNGTPSHKIHITITSTNDQ